MSRIVHTEASGYSDSRIKLLRELGFTEANQWSEAPDAEGYARDAARYLDTPVVVIRFADDHYAVWEGADTAMGERW